MLAKGNNYLVVIILHYSIKNPRCCKVEPMELEQCQSLQYYKRVMRLVKFLNYVEKESCSQ